MINRLLHLRLCLGIFFVFTLFSARLSSSTIVDYDCDLKNSSVSNSFVENVCENGVALELADVITFLDLDFVTPFFGVDEAHWFLSPNGFLTISSYSMCGLYGFCEDTYFNTLYGFYNFESTADTENLSGNRFMYGKGGDWPMIGIFVTSLQYSLSVLTPSIICLDTVLIDEVLTLVVQFNNLALAQMPQEGYLNAQLQLSESGAIKLLYNSVPDWPLYPNTTMGLYPGPYPSVGLIFSKDWRVVLPTPSVVSTFPLGYFCSPVEDPCDVLTSSTCEADGKECVFCSATQKCANSSVIEKICPSTSFTLPQNGVTLKGNVNAKLLSASSSRHSASSRESNAYSFAPLPENTVLRKESEGTSSSGSPTYLLENASILSGIDEIEVKGEGQESMGDPITEGENVKRDVVVNADEITAEEYQYYHTSITFGVKLSFLNSSSANYSVTTLGSSVDPVQLPIPFSFPFFGHTIEPGSVYFVEPGIISLGASRQSCNPIWNTCPNGNYSFAILPFQTAMFWSENTELIMDVMTDESTNETVFIMQVAALYPYNQLGELSVLIDDSSVTFQVNITSSGIIGIQLLGARDSPEYLLLAYPPPLVGIVRNTTLDPMSVMIPLSLIRSTTSIQFTPRNNTTIDKCNGECGSRGVCNSSTGKCNCSENFDGEKCDSCKAGYYGLYCNITHPEIVCDAKTGICECPSGWGGDRCTIKLDDCMSRSFWGCPSCLEVKGCEYCFDSTCYNPSIIGALGGYTCSYSVNLSASSLCQLLPQTAIGESSKSRVAFILVILCYAILLLSIGVSVYIRSWYFTSDENVLTANAVMGTSSIIPPDRTRTVLPVHRVMGVHDKENNYVLGIPIQQVPLKKLYERRFAERNRENWANSS